MATTSIGAPGVTFPDSSVQASATTGVPVLNVYTSSSTWTKPATVKAIKVTVVGGGGNGGPASTNPTVTPGLTTSRSAGVASGGGGGGVSVKTYPAASLPGPQPFTVGGATATSSFGGTAPVISATGGASGYGVNTSVMANGGAGGSGSGGSLNITGQTGGRALLPAYLAGAGGSSLFGSGGIAVAGGSPTTVDQVGVPGQNYGGGGGGAYVSPGPGPTQVSIAGGTGSQGVVIVEEFY